MATQMEIGKVELINSHLISSSSRSLSTIIKRSVVGLLLTLGLVSLPVVPVAIFAYRGYYEELVCQRLKPDLVNR